MWWLEWKGRFPEPGQLLLSFLQALPIALLAAYLLPALALIVVFISAIVGPRRPTDKKLASYESGMTPIGPAVRRLRNRKHREEKPFAVIFPSLQSVAEACHVSELETRLLCSPEAPITLLRRRKAAEIRMLGSKISEAVAPGNPWLGVMLAGTPLHHLLLAELDAPVVATSGNLADEPICTDEREAVERLHGIADLFLVHNRPIVRHLDDSIVRVMAGRELILRRARGHAAGGPRPLAGCLHRARR